MRMKYGEEPKGGQVLPQLIIDILKNIIVDTTGFDNWKKFLFLQENFLITTRPRPFLGGVSKNRNRSLIPVYSTLIFFVVL